MPSYLDASYQHEPEQIPHTRDPGNPYQQRHVSDSPQHAQLQKGILQCMTVVRITMQRHGTTSQPPRLVDPTLTDLAPELVAFVCLPRADAFHRWFMNTVDLLFVLSLLRKDSSGGFQ